MPSLYAGEPSKSETTVMSPSTTPNGDAEPVVPAFLPLAQLRVLLRIHEVRVRIQRLQHAGDRAVDDAVGLDLVDVARLDGIERRGERAVVLGEPILGGGDAAAHHAADNGGQRDGRRTNREKP